MMVNKKSKIIVSTFVMAIIIMLSTYIYNDINSNAEHTANNETQDIANNEAHPPDSKEMENTDNRVETSKNEIEITENTSSISKSEPVNDGKETGAVSNLTPPTNQEIQPAPSNTSGKYIVGYYASWASTNNFLPSNIDASKLTHINYAFADISSENKIIMSNPNVDIKNFDGLRKLKNENPTLKLLISIGGWDGSKYFSNAALTAESRETFADSCVDFILKYGFDGIDLDWEYPVSGGITEIINRPEDKQNFSKLIQVIRQKLNEQSNKDLKQYYLTIAGAPSTSYIKNIELSKILPYIDYIFIMGYDLHGPWDKYADFNAPLYNPKEASPQYSISVNDAVQNYINAGAPASKLVLGMPFYGYKYSLNDTDNDGLFQTFSQAVSIGYDKVANDYLNNPLYDKSLHSQAKVPYIFGNNTFITYEDANSILLKVQLARNFGMAGVGVWELSHDRKGVLLTSAYNALCN